MSSERSAFRHEQKYLISEKEMWILKKQMEFIMNRDIHGGDNGYFIRSLYFDDRDMDAYDEKLAGVDSRKKYRIRMYDFDSKVIKLECKRKEANYINKIAASLSVDEYEKILRGDVDFLLTRGEKVCKDFYLECKLNGMKPVVMVDYDRVPYVYKYGDVRVTFDMHVRSSFAGRDMLDRDIPTFEVLESGWLIMEVKYTEFLPSIVRDILSPKDGIYTAASKYVMCLEKRNDFK